jgi:hypothetical protein
LPANTIRVEAADIQIMLAPAEVGKLDAGILFRLPPPIGALRVQLTRDQIADLHTKLDSLLALDDDAVTALVNQIHHNHTEEDK